MAAERYKVTATIANGASLSDALQIFGSITRIEIPSAWTAAALTFQVSSDGSTFIDHFDDGNSEIKIASASIPTAAARSIRMTRVDWTNLLWIKLRSGTTSAAVNQLAERKIVVVKTPYGKYC